MSVTLHLGIWIIPVLVTVIAFGLALYTGRNDGKHHGYAAIGAGMLQLVLLLCAAIISLVAWLVWAMFQ